MPTDDIVRLYDFQPLTTVSSSQVDAELNQIVATLNGKMGRSVDNTLSGNNTFSGTNSFSGTTNLTGSANFTGVSTFSNTVTVPNDSFAYAKIQNVSATNKLLGRYSAGSGDIQEIAISSGLAVDGSGNITTKGDWETVYSGSLTGAATYSITSVIDPTTHSAWRGVFSMTDLDTANQTIGLRVSINNGSSFISGASSYGRFGYLVGSAAALAGSGGFSSLFALLEATAAANSTAVAWFEFETVTAASGTKDFHIQSRYRSNRIGIDQLTGVGIGGVIAAGGDVDAIQILSSAANNFAGSLVIEGRRI